jgi:hypothetical protein
MTGNYLILVEESVKGTKPAVPTLIAIPISGKLKPEAKPKDEPRKEFRGMSNALGYQSVIRRENEWSYSLETAWYAGPESGILLKHTLGYAGARATVDGTAKKGILYPLTMAFGPGSHLGTKAIGLLINEEVNGATVSQYFGGGRIKSCEISGKPNEDIKLKFELTGDGAYIGAAAQAAIEGFTFTDIEPFIATTGLAEFFIGAGIVRTGTAPDFDDIDPSGMIKFIPNDFSVKITTGIDEKRPIGPKKTVRSGQFKVDIEIGMDYEAPATGFSPKAHADAIFAAILKSNLVMRFNNGQLAGATTEKYSALIDIPAGSASSDNPDINDEGKTGAVKFKWSTLMSIETKYPVGFMLVDQEDAY